MDENGSISGPLGSINIPNSINPKTTSKIQYEAPANLKADAQIPKYQDGTIKVFESNDSTTYNYVNTLTTYDSLGTSHILTQYFQKTGVNTWRIYTTLDDRAVTFKDGKYDAIELKFNENGALESAKYTADIQESSNATAINADTDGKAKTYELDPKVVAGSVQFDIDGKRYNDDGRGNIIEIDTGKKIGEIDYYNHDTGKAVISFQTSQKIDNIKYNTYSDTVTSEDAEITDIKSDIINYANEYSTTLNDGAENKALSFNIKNITQLTSDYIFYAQQDGSGKGDLMAISVSEDGVIKGSYTNGQVKDVARLAVATFKDKEILIRKGDNLYLPNQQTFTPIIVPGGVISKIRSGMLEMSNVDISQEFINLITAQRAYQASAKTITTSDQVLQTTMDIKR